MKPIWAGLWRGMTILLGLFLLYQVWLFAHVLWWIDHNPSSSAFMEAGLERIQEDKPDAELRHKWVPYTNISIHLKRAIIAAEDAKFLNHEGFDIEGIQKAVEKKPQKRSAGGRRFHY